MWNNGMSLIGEKHPKQFRVLGSSFLIKEREHPLVDGATNSTLLPGLKSCLLHTLHLRFDNPHVCLDGNWFNISMHVDFFFLSFKVQLFV